jgi:DNA-binding CsgD family transcriptional regulator
MSEGSTMAGVDHDALLKEIAGVTNQFDVFRFLKKTTELFRARAFIVLRVPSATTFVLQAASVITSWPAELLAKYDQEGLLPSSAAMLHIRTSSLPIAVDVSHLREDIVGDKKDRIVQLFERYNMPRGAFFPVCDPAGDRGGIGFSGDREAFSSYEMLQLHMICTFVFERLYHIGKLDQRAGDDLTQREIDCLNWTAAGKTSLEISDILNLSEHTVNHYLNRAAKKLDTVNRTQAVAKALRMGIIN